jgi:hypothetical protein
MEADMDIGRILARSLELAWRFKVLWILGFIMALTGGGANGFNYSLNRGDFNNPQSSPSPSLTPSALQPTILITVLAIAACLTLLYLVLMLYFRFVARGAQVTFVRSVENGTTPSLGTAWREGQRYYARLLGLGFLFGVPLAIFTIVLLLITFLPLLGLAVSLFGRLSQGQSPTFDAGPIISGVLGFLGLLCCAVLCLWIVQVIVHPIYEFAVRGIVLEETGTIDGVTRAYRRLRSNLGPVALIYLVLIGARIGWSIITAIFVIPMGLLLLAVITLGAGVLPVWAIILLGLMVGLPSVLVLVFLGGLFQVFESNTWTESYLALLGQPTSPHPLFPEAGAAATD